MGNSSSSEYDPDLAYGSDHGSPPRRAPSSFDASVGGVRFSTRNNVALMRQIFEFVADASSHFGREISEAGPVTVLLGSTTGRTPGEWRAGSRTIMLNPTLASPLHLGGTAVFEILNAASARRMAGLEADVRTGHLADQAARHGWRQPEQFFARELEHIEWENGRRHRDIVAATGAAGTSADLFSGEGDFESYFERQVLAGHTHSYEYRYHYLRAEADAEAARAREQTRPSSRGRRRDEPSEDDRERHHHRSRR